MKCIENSTCWTEFGVLDPQARGFCLGPVTRGWFQALSFLFFLAGFFGNSTVIVVLLKTFQDLSSTDLFIIGLALLDLFSSIFLPLYNFLELTDLIGTQTDHGCGLISLMYKICITMSVYLLLFTVYSFYRTSICLKPDNKRKLRFFVLFLVAFALAAVPAVPVATSVHAVDGVCHIAVGGYTSFVLYTVAIFMIEVIFPVLISTIFFTRIGLAVYSEGEQQINVEVDVDLMERSRIQRKSRLLLIVVCTYYIIYLPCIFAVLWFMIDFGSKITNVHECSLFDIFHLIICAKCFVNPIIYYFFYDGFKENVKRILCGCKIGRRYNFMHAKYHFRRDHQESLVPQDSLGQEDHDMREMQDWVPNENSPVSKRDTALDDKDHDYDDDANEDDAAILRTWRSFKSTSSF